MFFSKKQTISMYQLNGFWLCLALAKKDSYNFLLFILFLLLFNLFLLPFMSFITLFGIIYGSHYTISASFKFYL